MKTEPEATPRELKAAPQELKATRRIDSKIIEEASHWLAKLWSAPDDQELLAASLAWRSANPQHEVVWQRLQNIGQKLDAIPPAIARNTLLESPNTSRRVALKLFSVAAVMSGAGYLFHRTNAWQQPFATHRTALGETRQLTLEDGTRLWMNTNTSLDVEFTNLRKVILYSGELFVETGKDPQSRPFIVVTAQGDIRPIGTAFAVRSDSDNTKVSVHSGQVELLTAATKQRVQLDSGQQTHFSSTQIFATDKAGTTPGWIKGFLVAERMSLKDFASELARYRRGRIDCDADVATLQLTGVFPLKDTDRALANLTQVLPVELEYRTRYWVTIKARKASHPQ